MEKPRIALLNAAFSKANTRRNFRRELAADLTEFDVTGGHVPESYDGFDGVVVTGSRASVYWDEPWIDAARVSVRDAVDAGLPVLGVCWGHQLLADALGGRVEDMGEFEIGYRTVRRTDGDDAGLFDGIDREFTAFTTHGDEVVELPPGAVELAANDYSVQAFRTGHAFGVQFHPEYDTETAREVTLGKEFLDDDRIESVLDGITEENYEAACRTKALFDNFVEYVRAHGPEVAAD
ncbi:hypothetical protein BRD00_08680 [Halobacteriales archaeon QS_8_69_26]|nr:MAG: hypothetical protein BRD00_08680 [Halobacteriales archaeon QS_8_69_26]